MTTSRPDNEAIFHAARDIPDPDRRREYVREACGGDEARIAHIEALLAAADGPDSLLDRPAAGNPMATIHQPTAGNPMATIHQPTAGNPMATIDQPTMEGPGTVIGPYKLIEPIGEGGMGSVWMAQQTEPVKRVVALKLIKAGMDSKQVIARFEAERQALALMDHANIARVLDAGTTSAGRPYFVMDLVKGMPITKYCDAHHLTPRQRLELFVPVCQAVQHAHQKGIIHRDIKPSNVLVALYDGKPVPKVIDFGVAKAAGQALTDKTLVTGLGVVVGTLEYMSPEQAEVNPLDIDTRSDIYALGVLLYELLAGSPPFSRKELETGGMLEMLRVIREQEPSKPSTKLSSSDALPTLSANRSTEPARLTKLVRGELDWIVMKALEKDRNRRYETANGFAMDVQRYLADEPVQACPPSAAYRLRKLVRRNKAALAVASVVAAAVLFVVGSIGYMVRDRAAERTQRMTRVAGQVELILQEVDRLEQELKWPEALAAARRAEAAVAGGDADAATAEQVHQRVKDLEFIDRLEQIRMLSATLIEGKFNHAGANREYARAFRDYGVDVEELAAETSIDRFKARSALAIPLAAALDTWVYARRAVSEKDAAGWKRLVAVARGIDPDPLRDRLRSTWGQPVTSESQAELRRVAQSIDIRAQSPATLMTLASTLRAVKDSDTAVRILRDAQNVYRGDFWLNFYLGDTLSQQKDYDGAIRFYTAAVAIRPNSTAALSNLGLALRDQKKLDEAIACYQKAIELGPKNAIAHNCLGVALAEQGKRDEAIACYRKAIELDAKYAMAHSNLGGALYHQGKRDEAIAACNKAIELDPKNAAAHHNLGNALLRQKKDDAIAEYRKAIELDPKFFLAHFHLAIELFHQKKLDEAITEYRKAIDLARDDTHFHWQLGHLHWLVGHALYAKGRVDEAIAAYRKATELAPKGAGYHNSLGGALDAQGHVEEAIVEYRAAIELNSKNAATHHNLGDLLKHKGDLDGAERAYREAARLDGKSHALAIDALTELLLSRGKAKEAIATWQEFLALSPHDASAHWRLGNALKAKGDLDEAVAAYRKAVELDPKSAPAHLHLGKALEVQGKLAETIGCFEKAIELNPNWAVAHNALAWLLTNCREPKLRDPQRGLGVAQRAVELAPQSAFAWQILGWAYYRAGDWTASIEALEKSCALQNDPKGGDSSQWFFLAMARWRLGEKDKAREWYDRAVEWMDKNQPKNEELRRFRAEASELLELKEKK